MCVWFATLAVLGIAQIVADPSVLRAVNPLYAVALFASHGWQAFVVLGAVVLAVTGAEALYADMGHFGRRPIRLAWFSLVLPALLLNYFGQGALLLRDPDAVVNPFYLLAPSWALYPMVVLATWATVIASQAVISGAFSLTQQAIQLGYLPRLEMRHTSEQEIGQIYVPRVNWALMVAVVAVVVGFGSSSGLAAAYGIAVARHDDDRPPSSPVSWRSPCGAGIRSAPGSRSRSFLAIDLAFFSSNALKIPAGGWFPIVVRRGRVHVDVDLARGARSLVPAAVSRRPVAAARFSPAWRAGSRCAFPAPRCS